MHCSEPPEKYSQDKLIGNNIFREGSTYMRVSELNFNRVKLAKQTPFLKGVYVAKKQQGDKIKACALVPFNFEKVVEDGESVNAYTCIE